MIITTTAIAFMSSSLGLGLCGFLFLRAFWKMGGLKAGNKSSFLLLGLIFSTAIQHSIMGFGNLFFAYSPTALRDVVVIGDIFLALATVFGIYLFFYLFLPRISPWPATIMMILYGATIITATAITQSPPFIDAGGSIDWNFPHWLESLLYILIFFNIGTMLSAFIATFIKSKDRETKLVSAVVIFITSLGLINIFLRFVLFSSSNMGPVRNRFFDVILIIIGIVLIVGLLTVPFARKRIMGHRIENDNDKD